MLESNGKGRFAQLVLPHLDGAFNLACWLLLGHADGEDVVQKAVQDAHCDFDRFHGHDARAWFLRFVHQTCYGWLEKNHALESTPEFEEGSHPNHAPTPRQITAQGYDRKQFLHALESLPVRLREMILLREVEGCSYKEIAEITGIPASSVMSTLYQAREQLQRSIPVYPAGKEA